MSFGFQRACDFVENSADILEDVSQEMLWWTGAKLIDEADMKKLNKMQDNRLCDVVLVPGKFWAGIQPNHLALFREANNLSPKSIVVCAMNSTRSLAKTKGPYNLYSDRDRVEMASCNHFIDFVVLFDEETPKELCKVLEPRYLVKGHDWKDREADMPELDSVVFVEFVAQEKPYHTSDKWKTPEENMKL